MIINLTPHNVVVFEDGQAVITYKKSNAPVRCMVDRVKVGSVNGFPLYKTRFGKVEGLPEPEGGVYYVVSRVVAEAMKGKRNDLIVPDGTVRDSEGRIIGCTGFAII